jgi:hypothetical protein
MSLMDCAEVRRWDIGSFKVGEFSLESLLNQVSNSDFREKEARYFSTTDGAAPLETEIKQCVYIPASPDDLAILDDLDGEKVPSLAKKPLASRKSPMA